MRLRSVIAAVLLLSACASGPQEVPTHKAPLNDAEKEAFRKVLGIHESFFELFDYVNYGALVAAIGPNGAKGLYQEPISPNLKLRLDGTTPPYTGTATVTISPRPVAFLAESKVPNVTIGGNPAMDRDHYFIVHFVCETDVVFTKTGITFNKGATLDFLLDLHQKWDYDSGSGSYAPTLEMMFSNEHWMLPAGAITGVAASGFLVYAHEVSPGKRRIFTGGNLQYQIPGAIPAVEYQGRLDGAPVLQIGTEPYDTWNYATVLAPLTQHTDDYIDQQMK